MPVRASDRILERNEWTQIRNVGSTTAANSSSGATTLVLNKPAGVVVGDQLIAAIVTRTGSSTFTLPSGWVQVASATTSGGATTAVFRHTVGAADPASWTWTINSSVVASGSVVAYRGVNPIVPVTTTTAGFVTASSNSSMASLAVNVGNTLDPGSPYSQLLMISGVKSGSTTAPTISSPSGMNTTATALSNGTTKVSVQTADQLLSTLGKPGVKSFTYSPLSFPTGIGLILNPVPAKTQRYVFRGKGDGPSATLTATNVLIEKTYGLVGGTLVTDRTPSGGTKTFSYTGLGGSVVATRDQAGTLLTARSYYGPFGETPNVYPDNADGQADYGWKGGAKRSTEHVPGMPTIIEMGARAYAPSLGRFLETDPIEGGATTNSYGYVDDPVNSQDLNGRNRCEVGWNPFRYPGNLQDCASKTARAAGRVVMSALHAVGRAVATAAKAVGRALIWALKSVVDLLKEVGAHLVLGVSVCIFYCIAISNQGGHFSAAHSTGLMPAPGADLSVGAAVKKQDERSCGSINASLEYLGGAYYSVGQDESGNIDGGDSEFGLTLGVGGGYSAMKSFGECQ